MRLTSKIEVRDPNDAIYNSRCDKSRLPFSLASHEGGHILFSLDAPLSGELVFMKQSIINLWDEYFNEFRKLTIEGKKIERANIFIGIYGHNQAKLGEFMAECFQEYRNSSNPSKYAIRMGKIIDSYLKK